MEFENILKLIESVSNSSLSSFTLEEGETKLVLESNKGVVNATVNEVPVRQIQESKEENMAVTSAGSVVKSPLVGVFYSASSPESNPYVSVGDTVKKGQVLGIVEAMKLMNEIECEYDGVVEEILIQNAQMVEYGQPLFRIK